ncbi:MULTISPECIES: glycosyltransferase family 2 protein [Pseudoclavibacter]|uniref:Glycosyltransferase family 2 protein n=1 Tax=Pseudoclavibacter terrae TaxID=1530195 RepID=A0A7J5B5N3_9MICO|nr:MULTISPECIES: galactosyltransferase-related protein [Pseudoclavibacter]KAB1639427.1 glycosyltransferase family 2 protein [Pseudoclavibacter terrae]
MKTATITLAHGRHRHLLEQRRGLLRQSVPADDAIVIAMGDPQIAELISDGLLPGTTVEMPADASVLPLAAARNEGARVALERGAELLVFLDVDCIPGRGLVEAYQDAAQDPRWASSLLSGPVTYLEPPGPNGYDAERVELKDAPHPARPAPAAGEVQLGEDRNLFWSLSFAVTADNWRRIGGFHEGYRGYGAEDTDFARVAGNLGVGLAWVGGARAYHQWHPTSNPPVQHLHDIARNANLFRERWRVWPMVGWLRAFRELGLLEGGLGDEPCVVVQEPGQPRSAELEHSDNS